MGGGNENTVLASVSNAIGRTPRSAAGSRGLGRKPRRDVNGVAGLLEQWVRLGLSSGRPLLPFRRFSQFLYMGKNAAVDAVDDVVGTQVPVGGRPHAVAVPGCSDQAGVAVGQTFQSELAPVALKVVVQVGGVDG